MILSFITGFDLMYLFLRNITFLWMANSPENESLILVLFREDYAKSFNLPTFSGASLFSSTAYFSCLPFLSLIQACPVSHSSNSSVSSSEWQEERPVVTD